MRMAVYIPKADELAKRVGIDPNGPAQRWHTQNIMRHMMQFMPVETGRFRMGMVIQSAHMITHEADQLYYLYYGKRMVNAATGKGPRFIPNVGYRWPKGAKLVPTEEPLKYTKTFNPKAGPFWDQRMIAEHGNVIAKELEAYLKKTGAIK